MKVVKFRLLNFKHTQTKSKALSLKYNQQLARMKN